MKKNLLLSAVFICIGLKGAVAQFVFTAGQPPPTIQWTHDHVGGKSNHFEITNDGGYVIAGGTGGIIGGLGSDGNYSDFRILKSNSSGSIQWSKIYGGSNSEWALSVKQTNDGGYIVVGWTTSFDGDVTGHNPTISPPSILGFTNATYHNSDMWVLKLNNNGNIQWKKCIGGTKDEYAFDVIQTNDNGYLIAGTADTLRDSALIFSPLPVMHQVLDRQAVLIKLNS